MYTEHTIYIIGNSKTNTDNAITTNFNSFFIGFVIDTQNDCIVDVSCSATIRTTDAFIAALFMGKSFAAYSEDLESEVKRRYHGSSQRAIIVAYKDAFKKYWEVKEKHFAKNNF